MNTEKMSTKNNPVQVQAGEKEKETENFLKYSQSALEETNLLINEVIRFVSRFRPIHSNEEEVPLDKTKSSSTQSPKSPFFMEELWSIETQLRRNNSQLSIICKHLDKII